MTISEVSLNEGCFACYLDFNSYLCRYHFTQLQPLTQYELRILDTSNSDTW